MKVVRIRTFILKLMLETVRLARRADLLLFQAASNTEDLRQRAKGKASDTFRTRKTRSKERSYATISASTDLRNDVRCHTP